jgi:glycosyltransferase involved in cell wall biosynthesis
VSAPAISVVIPVHDGEAYLAESIDSVLGQSVAPAEVIVVANGCADASAEIAGGFGSRVQVVTLPEPSAPAARNAGVARATGELLAFNDADDVWEPGRLAAGVAAMAGPDRPDLVFGHVLEVHSPELTEEQRAALPPARGIVPGRVIISLLAGLAAMRRVGPFDEALPAADFLDWLSRARALGLTETMLDTVIARRRVHPANTRWPRGPRTSPRRSMRRSGVGREGTT